MGSPACWVMAAANIDWRYRAEDSQAKVQGRCGKARKAFTDKHSKVWRSRSKFLDRGSFLKRSRLSQRGGVGRSTINSQATFFWADKQVRDARGKSRRVKIFKKKTERVEQRDLPDSLKIRKTCQQRHPKFGQEEVRRSRINNRGGSKFKGSYGRQSRNSLRSAKLYPYQALLCQDCKKPHEAVEWKRRRGFWWLE